MIFQIQVDNSYSRDDKWAVRKMRAVETMSYENQLMELWMFNLKKERYQRDLKQPLPELTNIQFSFSKNLEKCIFQPLCSCVIHVSSSDQ